MKPAPAIALGSFAVALLDGLDAVVFFGLQGVPPIRIFQAIASGLIGGEAFRGGLATAALGPLLHVFIAFVIVLVYYLASSRVPTLVNGVLIHVFGVGIPAALAAYAGRRGGKISR